jgi:hypothetical protein
VSLLQMAAGPLVQVPQLPGPQVGARTVGLVGVPVSYNRVRNDSVPQPTNERIRQTIYPDFRHQAQQTSPRRWM